MSTCCGRLEDHITPPSFKGCFYMLPSWDRRKWKGWSAMVVGMVFWGWLLRQMFPPSSLWGIGLPERRFGNSSMRYTCSKGCPTCHPVGPNRWKRPSETFCPLWGATYEGGEVLLSWKRTKGWLLWPFHSPATKLNPTLRPKEGATHKALQEANEMHQQVLESALILEMNIERLNKEANGTKHWCSLSHSHPQGRSLERHVQSPNWHRPKGHVTFYKPEEGTSSDERPQREPQEHSTRGEVEEGNLGPLPTLRPELEHFLEISTPGWGTRGRWGYPPELSIKNYKLWLEWWACQLDTSHWWKELTAILEVGDIKKLAQKISTSLDVPAV